MTQHNWNVIDTRSKSAVQGMRSVSQIQAEQLANSMNERVGHVRFVPDFAEVV